jgi:hypothetical protein
MNLEPLLMKPFIPSETEPLKKRSHNGHAPKAQGHTIRMLSASFNLPLHFDDINRWRGSWNELVPRSEDLFHNHRGQDGLYHRYPMIQYRKHGGKASIFAFNEGVDAMQNLIRQFSWEVKWKGKARQLQLEKFHTQEFRLEYLDHMQAYTLKHWLPFNRENFIAWKQEDDLIARVKLLNAILVGHIFDFSTGMGWKIPDHLEVKLKDIQRRETVHVHNTQRPMFDVCFKTNVALPWGTGLGKSVSLGFGLLQPGR